MPIVATRALLAAALDGSLTRGAFRKDPFFGFEVPVALDGVDPKLLDPRQTWADPTAYDASARRLVGMFAANFAKYVPFIDEEIRAAAIG
jgi:phosphoenolpyruvate carboxykinase (ATP)